MLDKTYILVYDNNGNIVKRREFAFTLKDNTVIEELESTDKAYTYNGDQMVSYNGESCVYDLMGNPTTYRGKSATWTNGRRLASYDGHTFTYDGQGRRLTKDNVTFAYDMNGKLIKQGDDMEFFYDHTGVAGLKYNGAAYLYRKDVQNNVIALIDENGAIVARYLYDAWGNVAVVDNNGVLISDANHIGNLNPFRYRGYYYDTETKLYFLKTRYYDPEIGRFMTIDNIGYLNSDVINGLNLYAYCGNNPVMGIDPNGNDWWNPFEWDPIGRFIAGVAVAAAGLAITIASLRISMIPGSGVITQAGISMAAYGGIMVASVFDSKIETDMNAIGGNPFNTDAGISSKTNKVSFYNGVPVFMLPTGIGSFSFGVIVFDESSHKGYPEFLKHEWGHSVQFGILGLIKYGLGIAVPSLTGSLLSSPAAAPGTLSRWLSDHYEDLPWERTAELFGNVSGNTYEPISLPISIAYFGGILLI